MKGRRVLWVMLLVTALMVTAIAPAFAAPPPWGGPKQDREQLKERIQERLRERLFSDEDEAPWASCYMMKATAKGFMKGYPDGKFQPNASISQTEAVVTALRYAGYDEDDLDEAGDGFYLPGMKSVDWAGDWLYTASEEGLIDPEEFQVNKAASRSWVCWLLARASGVESEDFEIDEEEPLSFSDVKSIPEEHLWAVYWAVEEGIVEGYPNGKFMPNKPVTRAEMAKILDGSDLYFRKARVVKGVIIDLDLVNDEITLKVRKGLEETFRLQETTRVFIAGEKMDLEDLKDLFDEMEEDEESLKIFMEVCRDNKVCRIFVPRDSDDDGEEDDED